MGRSAFVACRRSHGTMVPVADARARPNISSPFSYPHQQFSTLYNSLRNDDNNAPKSSIIRGKRKNVEPKSPCVKYLVVLTQQYQLHTKHWHWTTHLMKCCNLLLGHPHHQLLRYHEINTDTRIQCEVLQRM